MWIFEPILKTTIWGGSRIAEFKKMGYSPRYVGESWELSAVSGSESVVAQGKDKGLSIVNLINREGELLLGRGVVHRFGYNFPLLVKLIDARESLSIQVHPNDEMAGRYGKHGKSEMWYVIDAERKSKICNGFKFPLTIEDYDAAFRDGNIKDMLLFTETHPGDVFYVPAGRIHTIGAGVFLAEIQQSSDLTFRVYDYDRRDADGNLRELHVAEAREALNFCDMEGGPVSYVINKNDRTQLIDSPYFTSNLYEIDRNRDFDYSRLDSFVVLLCVEGEGMISDGNETLCFSPGSTVLLPACVNTVSITTSGRMKFLETYIA